MTVKLQGRQDPGRRGRPLKNDATPDMRERILDAAEDHFSRHGFWGVTIREVAQDAKVDTALAALLLRYQARPVRCGVRAPRRDHQSRAHRFDRRLRAAPPATAISAEGVINAFLQPILQRAAQGDPHWHNYFALIAQVNNTPAWGGETMARTFDPVIHRLIRALRKALPDASEEDLYWSYHFLSGALTLSLSQTGRIDRLSNGLCKSSDFESIGHRMAPFIASGFERLCKPVAEVARRLSGQALA